LYNAGVGESDAEPGASISVGNVIPGVGVSRFHLGKVVKDSPVVYLEG